MLKTRIIPCLDVNAGRVVKGVRFQNLRDSGDPTSLALSYQQQGADELVVLDISATPEGRGHQLEVITDIRKQLAIPLTVGGGVRRAADVEQLLLAGADKVALNTAAVSNPELIGEIAERFGRQCTVLAIDAVRKNHGWKVVTHSGSKTIDLDVIRWAQQGVAAGAGEILLTSFDRDGTQAGYDLELLTAVSSAVSVPVIASGGAQTAQHLKQAIDAGADAVLAASIFHDNKTTVSALKQELMALGIEVRT
jgi:imidazole glycerol-phosphate synthase subunit HisF